MRDSEARNRPQLALFSIAMPVNPPSIVEIRAKMLLFQSKHQLDFTPMAMDSRSVQQQQQQQLHSTVQNLFGCSILLFIRSHRCFSLQGLVPPRLH